MGEKMTKSIFKEIEFGNEKKKTERIELKKRKSKVKIRQSVVLFEKQKQIINNLKERIQEKGKEREEFNLSDFVRYCIDKQQERDDFKEYMKKHEF